MIGSWWTIQSASAGSESRALVRIYGPIGGGFFADGPDAASFAQQLEGLGQVDVIDVRINSPGGSVFEGLAIYNTLLDHSARIEVKIDGIAASIASVIAMAGDTVTMPDASLMMIHDPSALVAGDETLMRKMADVLAKVKTVVISAYRRKSQMSETKIGTMMSAETWFTPAEAVDAGLADEVSPEQAAEPPDGAEAAAAWRDTLAAYSHVPQAALSRLEQHAPPESGSFHQLLDELRSMRSSVSVLMARFGLHGKDAADAAGGNIMTIDEIRAQYPEIAAALIEEGRSSVDVEAAVEAERERIRAVLDAGRGFANQMELERLAFDEALSPEDAAAQILEAERARRRQIAADTALDAPAPVAPSMASADGAGQSLDALPANDAAARMWASNEIFAETGERVRDAFLDAEGLAAYLEAKANGQIKILSGREAA